MVIKIKRRTTTEDDQKTLQKLTQFFVKNNISPADATALCITWFVECFKINSDRELFFSVLDELKNSFNENQI